MTQFENKVTEIKVSDDTKTPEVGQPVPMRNITYAELAINCLNNQPEGGWSVSEMRDRMNIEEKLTAEKSNPGAIIELEDAELKKLQECELAIDGKWLWKEKDIVIFSDYVRSLEPIKIPERIAASGENGITEPVVTD